MLGPLCAQTNKRDSVVKHNEHSKKCAFLNKSHKNGHRNHRNNIFYKNIFRSIDRSIFVSYGTHAMNFCVSLELLCIKDAEAKKSLVTVCRTSTLYPSIRNNPMKYRVLEPQLQRRIMSFCFTKIP